MNEPTTVTREQMLSDLRAVVADSEELLRATAGAVDERAAAARARVEESLAAAKAKIEELDSQMLDRLNQAVKAADEYVHEHPWGAVGIAAAAGLLVGVLIARR
ncbi:MAG TPA: DUF883 family protein [Candidatus Eisenbacteria bacterium]|nr:DUF883 family protein [Candidatus Eisenbacteria bacterium]